MSPQGRVEIQKGSFRALVRVGDRSAVGFNHRDALNDLNIEGVKAFTDEPEPIVERLFAVTDDIDMAIVTRDFIDGTLKVTGNSETFGLPKNLLKVRPKTLSHLQTKYHGEKFEST